jgi:threonine dehydratase
MTIGNTPLIQIPEISNLAPHAHLWIKDESSNPSETWKDRRSEAALKQAEICNRNHVCLVTAGNAALSIATISAGSKLRVTAIVGPKVKPSVIEALEQKNIRVIHHELKEALNSTKIQNLARAKDNPNDQPFDITGYFHNAYQELYLEIVRAINPDFIVAPYGTGEAVFGLVLGALAQQRALQWAAPKDYPITTPKIIGVQPEQPNSLADKLDSTHSPYPDFLIDHPKHFSTIAVSEAEIQQAYYLASPHLQTERSAATAFAAISQLTSNPKTHGEKIVIINSGRGIF